MNKKRKELIRLSLIARAMIKDDPEEFPNVNTALLALYQEDHPGAETFNTFKQWKETGMHIVKGSKSFAVWAKPLKAKPKEEDKMRPDDPEETYKFWPICYLFSNEQVIDQNRTIVETEEEDDPTGILIESYMDKY